MKKLAKIYKTLSNRNSSDGFTLIELLVAASIAIIIVGGAGLGLAALTVNNKKTSAETQRRVELNRALDFIADEVRQSQNIATDASANLSTVAPHFNSVSGTPVLQLQIPSISEAVIYYIAPKPANSPWIGPNVIYRWGPHFQADQTNANGLYSDPTTPTSWTSEPLADLIVDTTPSPSASCASNWSLNPPAASVKGFYACVDPSNRIAEIHLRGNLTDAFNYSIKPFEVSSQVFGRTSSPAFTLGSAGPNSNGTATNSGAITITQPASANFQVLGGSISCGQGGPQITTTTTINVTPQGGVTTPTTIPSNNSPLSLPPLAVGTKISVTGKALGGGVCPGFGGSSYNSVTDNGTQVLSLHNGDQMPPFTPFGGQPSIKSYLNGYLDSNNRVTIADNQVIFLFELGATDKSSSAYDMQDLVVLGTISPK